MLTRRLAALFTSQFNFCRKSLTEVADQGRLDENKRLVVDGHEVIVSGKKLFQILNIKLDVGLS